MKYGNSLNFSEILSKKLSELLPLVFSKRIILHGSSRVGEGRFPASLGSQSWVGCDHGHIGGVGGEGAENWCVGKARERLSQQLDVPRCCGKLL